MFDAFFGAAGPFRTAAVARPAARPAAPTSRSPSSSTFEEAVFGTQEPVVVRTAVPCDDVRGDGRRAGTSPATCGDCGGAGQVRRVRQSILGQMVTAGLCGRCGGSGEVIERPCPDCRGEGRTRGEDLHRRHPGRRRHRLDAAALGPRRGRPAGRRAGDLYVHLRVRPHERFQRQGYDLVHELHVPMTQAALGAHLVYETLDGAEDLVIPPGTQTGRVFRLRGRGVPHVEGRGRGDLLVQVVVDTPTDLTPEQEELLRQLAGERGEDVAPADTGFFSRIRSAFK